MRNNVIDIHMHFGAPRDPGDPDGCFWSKDFEKSVAYFAMRLVTRTLFKKISFQIVKDHFLKVAAESKKIDGCVLLAMDKVYDENGRPRDDLTHLYVPNRAIEGIVREHPERFLFGASIHPYKKEEDWQAELARCLVRGAVLCKWIPSSMLIDPSHPRCVPFYEKLAEHELPLLCHAGPEDAIPTSDGAFEEFNNPKYLEKALDIGVPVVLAHCALPFVPKPLSPFEPYRELLRLLQIADQKNWKLYVDVSALCLFRDFYIPRVIENIPARRILYGSDYPIPMLDLAYKKRLSPRIWAQRFLKTLFERNLLDKNYFLIEDMGFDPLIFTNAAELFAKIVR